MGVTYFVACRSCKTFRDLDKFYTILHDVQDRDSALEFAKRIEQDSFRAGLLISFMWAHRGHDCFVNSEFEDDELSLFTEESSDFWHPFQNAPERHGLPETLQKKSKSMIPSQWIVRVRCVVVKEVICENCTKEEARTNPWDHVVCEQEIEQIDWDVTRVEKG